MESTNRITKDTSARKTGKGMHEALEMAAVKASQEAYWNSILAGYKATITEMESEHELQLERMQVEHEKSVCQLNETRASMVKDAIQVYAKDTDRQFASLKTTISELETQKKSLQASLEENRKVKELLIAGADKDRARSERQIATIKKNHSNDMLSLQKQLEVGPNSWVRINVKRKHGSAKTYWRRPTASFSEAIQEFDDMAKKTSMTLNYKVGELLVDRHSSQTLQQLGIKDNDEIYRQTI